MTVLSSMTTWPYLVMESSQTKTVQIDTFCLYDLKEQKPVDVDRYRSPSEIEMISPTGCVYDKSNGVLFYGRIVGFKGRGPGARGPLGISPSPQSRIVKVKVMKHPDGEIFADPEFGNPGPGDPSSVCHVYEEDIYVYDPYDNEGNNNFGSIQYCPLKNGDWKKLQINCDNMKLNQPSHNVVFINGVLYLFADDVNLNGRIVETGSSFIEDVYMLDLKRTKGHGTWQRVSLSCKRPGALTNISLAEAEGRIYVFGTSEGKSVLWVYNTNEQGWKQVSDIGKLTAGRDQRAVIYGGQLLVVNWDYSKDAVQIQYLKLDEFNSASLSQSGKEVCKGQTDELIQNLKTLANSRVFHDVVFEVKGEEIPAHKAILASRSDYFMKMFTSGISESHSAKIPIPNMRSDIFKAILQYIYCSEIELDQQLALDLIPTADEYVMKGLKGVCEAYLCKQLRKENVVDLLIAADRHEVLQLKEACFRFISINLVKIDGEEELTRLSKSLLVELLKFQALDSQKEKSKPEEGQKLPGPSQSLDVQEREIQLGRRLFGNRDLQLNELQMLRKLHQRNGGF